MALGLRTIRSEKAPLPIFTTIPRSEETGLRLDHPLPANGSPANPTGCLRLWLYRGRELAGVPLAEVAEPPVFDLRTPWLKDLIDGELAHSADNFSLRMRGWITFPSSATMVHLRSDNGYRLRFRNALGDEQKLDHWVDDVTDDSMFTVVAEPGRYEIEIDYFNGGGGFFFEISSMPQVEFEPAEAPPATAQ
jgi:hypothetical protein